MTRPIIFIDNPGRPHYMHHLAPIADELGLLGRDWQIRTWPERDGDLCVVASYVDARRCRRNPKIYVEHGAGQTYITDTGRPVVPGYASMTRDHLENVVGFIAPRRDVARRWEWAFDVPAFAVGCPAVSRLIGRPRPEAKRAAITFHWHADAGCIESGTAWWSWMDHMDDMIGWLRDDGYEVCGHEHPRWGGELAAFWTSRGVPFVDRHTVLTDCSLLVADNTSLMYEAAALGMDVICLDDPAWRLSVEHGLRFWSAAPGPHVNPFEWRVAVEAGASVEDFRDPVKRRIGVRAAYGDILLDRSAHRAADAIDHIATLRAR